MASLMTSSSQPISVAMTAGSGHLENEVQLHLPLNDVEHQTPFTAQEILDTTTLLTNSDSYSLLFHSPMEAFFSTPS